ncbi:MAG: aminotransferase class I/II-fold pyridoxal phosphate-dependent enzyme [Alphaproteobacteria bacterium]|nr:aminotransferase class I/II-fold pyridoxal phosphate-dependent enzyme [Alphaproteobacteria bacterium]
MADSAKNFDPIEALAGMRHEFGEHGGVNMSIEASTTFTVMQASTMPDIFQGRSGPEGGCFLYGRHFNPTVYVLGKQLAALEGTEAGYCAASGMAAIAAVAMQLTGPGDHVVCSDTVYGGTWALFKDFLPKKSGLEVTFVNTGDPEAVRAAMTPRTKMVYTEVLANPTLRVAPLDRLADIAHAGGAQLVVDNTFTPLMVSPARHGADVVVHSLTKYINGASDIIAGAICGTKAFVQSLMDLHEGALMLLGPTMDPKMAHNISLRLPHLGLRVKEHSHRGRVFAERLHELGLRVMYPGLREHPGRADFDRIRNPEYGYGGIFTLDLGDIRKANELMELLQNRDRFGYMAVSLGYFDTLMTASATTTSSEVPAEIQAQAGLTGGLVRMSLGYTGSLEQRWKQLKDALEILNLA